MDPEVQRFACLTRTTIPGPSTYSNWGDQQDSVFVLVKRRSRGLERFQMARFMIHWCAPDPTNEKYTQAIVDYIKGGKPMDEYAGFKVLARQIHPHLGGGCLLVEADNLVAVQKHTYPWTKGLGVTATITPGLSDEEYVELEESMSS